MSDFSKCRPGDTVVLQDTGKMQQLPSNWGGTADAWITVTSNGVEITGGVKCLGVHYVHFTNIKIREAVNGIQVSQSGSDFKHLCHDIIIDDCDIADCKEDGIKVSQTDHVTVRNNKITRCGQQCIDLFDCVGFIISSNDCSYACVSAAIDAKGGCRSGTIVANHIHDLVGNCAAIAIGGYSQNQYTRPEHRDWQAYGVGALSNVIENVQAQAVVFFAAFQCSVSLTKAKAADKVIVAAAIGVAPDNYLTNSRQILCQYNTLTGWPATYLADHRQHTIDDKITFK